jgi:hypothetical protein
MEISKSKFENCFFLNGSDPTDLLPAHTCDPGKFPNSVLRPSIAPVPILTARRDAEVRPSRLRTPHAPLAAEPLFEGTPHRFVASTLPLAAAAAAAPACDARMMSAPRQAPAQRHRFTPCWRPHVCAV